MAENSKIEWCTHTANLWHGCTKVHAGCDHCYAETLSHRWGNDLWGNDKPRRAIKAVWDDLDRYQKLAAAANEKHTVFVGSMMDIFEKPMSLINSKGEAMVIDTGVLRNMLFQKISDNLFPNLVFLLLTKRPSNINKYIPEAWKTIPPKNVWFGTSPVDEKTAEKLIPQLLKVNGNRFLSIEPQLGPINLRHLDADKGGDKDWCQIDCLTGRHTDMARPCSDVPTIHWVICGGESGHGARPIHPDWVRSIRDQCKAASVPFFFKQWGEYLPYEADAQQPFYKRADTGEMFDGHQMNFIDNNGDAGKWMGATWYDTYDSAVMNASNNDNDCCFHKIGKKAAGRLIDHNKYSQLPNFNL